MRLYFHTPSLEYKYPVVPKAEFVYIVELPCGRC